MHSLPYLTSSHFPNPCRPGTIKQLLGKLSALAHAVLYSPFYKHVINTRFEIHKDCSTQHRYWMLSNAYAVCVSESYASTSPYTVVLFKLCMLERHKIINGKHRRPVLVPSQTLACFLPTPGKRGVVKKMSKKQIFSSDSQGRVHQTDELVHRPPRASAHSHAYTLKQSQECVGPTTCANIHTHVHTRTFQIKQQIFK